MVDDNDMKLGGPYMPISFNRYSISPPGPAGGINFWGASYDPKLHLFISNTNNIFQPMQLILRPDGTYINFGPLAGTRRFGDADRRLLCGPTPWGELVAVNMDTGDIAYGALGVSTCCRRVSGHGPAKFRRRDVDGERPSLSAARTTSGSAHLRRRLARSSEIKMPLPIVLTNHARIG